MNGRSRRRGGQARRYRGHRRGKKWLERRKRTRTLVVSAILFVLILLFSLFPALSEGYMRHVYPLVATGLSFVSGLFPFSLYDLFLIVAMVWLLMLILFAFIRRSGFVRFLFSLLRFVTVVVAWFYFSWGIAYFREDFHTRGNVEEVPYDSEQFKDFATRFVEQANRAYDGRTGVYSAGMDKEGVRQEIESVYQRLQGPLRVAYPNGKRRVKPMMFQSLYSKTGVSGYFGPFFNEIHVNDYSLDFTYPFTLAHEMAHQFGVGPESEANLYAFVTCASSGDPRVRYSAYASTLGYVLNDAYRFLPDEYESIYHSVRPEILEDLKRNREHWLAARDEALSSAQDKMYDAYLKTNKVSSGQENYSEVVALLVSSYDLFSPFFR